MDRDNLLKTLASTFDADPQVRKESEKALHEYEKQPGFTAYCIDIAIDEAIPLGIQVSAAIFIKNRVTTHWLKADNKDPSPKDITPEEKEQIKAKLIPAILKTHNNTQLRLQFTTILAQIIAYSRWDDLLDIITQLLTHNDDPSYVYTGLLCAYELTRSHRWCINESKRSLDDIVNQIFPVLENLSQSLIEKQDIQSNEMLYLIIKVFKFATYSQLPSFFDDANKLGSWCQLHLLIAQKPIPEEVMKIDVDTRYKDPRIKVKKWAFANLHRLISRYGGGTKDVSSSKKEFVEFFNSHFVPEILNVYWSIIEKWSAGEVWMSEDSIYHLISFLENTIATSAWGLIEAKFDAIINHVIIPTLCADAQSVELFEEDPEEYVRRYLDTTTEGNTADVASVNFVYRLVRSKFTSVINPILTVLNDIFSARAADRNNLQVAFKVNAALRVLSTISFKLGKKNSPVVNQIDKILDTFVVPELNLSGTPYLAARACETISIFSHNYQDEQVLSNVFQGVVTCFQDEHLPVQLQAADALRSLIQEEQIATVLSPQVPQLMQKLLEMSNRFESDTLTSVMEAFVERFSKQLEPFAVELAMNLSNQFVKLGTELIELQCSKGDANAFDGDKEAQAAGILNTLTTMVISMNSSPEVSTSLEVQIAPLIKFVLDNALLSLLPEALDILESVLFNTKVVSPTVWELFVSCIDSFQTFANEYFDNFIAFFEAVALYGFKDLDASSPYVQSLIQTSLTAAADYTNDPGNLQYAFGLLELSILSLEKKITPILSEILSTSYNIYSKVQNDPLHKDHAELNVGSFIKVFLSALYVDPVTTFNFLSSDGILMKIFELWFNNSEELESVFGLKLQTLTLLSITTCDQLPSEIQQSFGQLVEKLVLCIEKLPGAINKRQAILEKETAFNHYNIDDEDDDEGIAHLEDDFADFEQELEEIDAMRETPLNDVNVFEVFVNSFKHLQNNKSERYNLIINSLSAEKLDTVKTIMNYSQKIN